jgi:hypothetical protein
LPLPSPQARQIAPSSQARPLLCSLTCSTDTTEVGLAIQATKNSTSEAALSGFCVAYLSMFSVCCRPNNLLRSSRLPTQDNRTCEVKMDSYTPHGAASSSPLKSARSPQLSASRSLSAAGLSSGDQLVGPSETSAPVGATDAVSAARKSSATATIAAAPARPGTYSFVVAGTNFQIDEKYKFIKVIGRGAYGVVM